MKMESWRLYMHELSCSSGTVWQAIAISQESCWDHQNQASINSKCPPLSTVSEFYNPCISSKSPKALLKRCTCTQILVKYIVVGEAQAERRLKISYK